jgi:hypothetical protein
VAAEKIKGLAVKKDMLEGTQIVLAHLSGWTVDNMKAAGWTVDLTKLDAQKALLTKADEFRFYARPEKAEDVTNTNTRMVHDLCEANSMGPDPLGAERTAVKTAKENALLAQATLKKWQEETGAGAQIDGVDRVILEIDPPDTLDQYKPPGTPNKLKFKMPTGAAGRKQGFIAMVAYYGSVAQAKLNEAVLGTEKVVDVAFDQDTNNHGITDTATFIANPDVAILAYTGGPLDVATSVNRRQQEVGVAEQAFKTAETAAAVPIAKYKAKQDVIFDALQKLPSLGFSKVKALK